MPLKDGYQYDVFISYKREDQAWAERLSADLEGKNLSVFRDEERLIPGKNWEPQLANALRQSLHLVVLWSDKADDSSWVRREIGHFESRNDAPNEEGMSGDSKIIFVVLEGFPSAFGRIEMIDDLKEQAIDVGNPEFDTNIWRTVVRKIDEAVREDDPAEIILLATIATTEANLLQLDPDAQLPGGFQSLNEFLQDLQMPSVSDRDDLVPYYGEKPSDWKPFGQQLNILDLMNELRDELNPLLPGTRISWKPIGNAFWSQDFEAANAQADLLATNWSVVVVDPISLYDSEVNYVMSNYLNKVFDSARAIFMALPPFGMPRHIRFRTLIERNANTFFRRHFEPPVFQQIEYAKCNVNIISKQDIKQWLLTSVGPELVMQSAAATVITSPTRRS